MFSVREVPWMQGSRNEDGAGFVAVSVLPDYPGRELAARMAGLDWTVEEAPVFRSEEIEGEYLGAGLYGPGVLHYSELDGWKVLLRGDTSAVLHVARESYGVVQNAVGFDILEQLVGADAAVKYETGGSVKGGALCYLSARVDEPFTVAGDDSPSFPYVVVVWAHDGSAAVSARCTTVRVVCANTISASEAEAARTGRRFTFRHTSKVLDRIEDARAALTGVREETKAFQALADELARTRIIPAQREAFVETFIPAPVGDVISDRVRRNIEDARDQVRGLFNGPTIPDAHRETAYGLLLAGTEYLDHLRGFRSTDTYLGRTLLREEALKARLVPMIRETVSATS